MLRVLQVAPLSLIDIHNLVSSVSCDALILPLLLCNAHHNYVAILHVGLHTLAKNSQ